MRKINASEFKAKCLSILDHVAKSGETVTILKRGRAVARLVPPIDDNGSYPQRRLKGSVTILGDILSPVVPAEDWDVEREG